MEKKETEKNGRENEFRENRKEAIEIAKVSQNKHPEYDKEKGWFISKFHNEWGRYFSKILFKLNHPYIINV